MLRFMKNFVRGAWSLLQYGHHFEQRINQPGKRFIVVFFDTKTK